MDPFIGEIRMVGFNFAPTGWALCQGQTLPISQNAALFSLLGTFYGGNGVSTFQLPNLQGRVPISQGQLQGGSVYTIGEIAGNENVSILLSNMPSHTHLVNCDINGGGKTTPGGNFPGAVTASATEKIYSAGPSSGQMAPTMVAPAGNNLPLSILQPFLVVNFIIALQGIFPSRS